MLGYSSFTFTLALAVAGLGVGSGVPDRGLETGMSRLALGSSLIGFSIGSGVPALNMVGDVSNLDLGWVCPIADLVLCLLLLRVIAMVRIRNSIMVLRGEMASVIGMSLSKIAGVPSESQRQLQESNRVTT